MSSSADGFGNDFGLEVFQPGGRGTDVGAAMAASGYRPADHWILRPEMLVERVLEGGNNWSFVHEGDFSRGMSRV